MQYSYCATKYLSTIALASFFLISSNSCGISTSGGSSTPNDAAPSGTVLVQGQFQGQNSITVSGSGSIYSTSSPTNFVARIEGISVSDPASSESGLQIQVNANVGGSSGNVLQTSLRSVTGTQNYTFSTSAAGPTFNTICIFSSQKNLKYGCAQLK